MRILVLANALAIRRALVHAVEGAGYEVVAAAPSSATVDVTRRFAPDLVLLDAASAAAAPPIVERARGAAERAIAVVLLLPATAASLRLPAVGDGVVALPRAATTDALAAVLGELEPYVRGHARARRVSLRLDSDRGVLRAHGGEVPVTRSESALLDALLREPGSVVPRHRLVAAIWHGRRAPTVEGAALRTHVYTSRRKLAEVAPAARIENRPGIGYVLRL